MQSIVTTEQLDLFALPAAQKERTRIVFRKAVKSDTESILAFTGNAARQNSIVMIDETDGGNELFGVIGWYQEEGFIVLESPILAGEGIKDWYREELIRLSVACIKEFDIPVYIFAEEQDVQLLKKLRFEDVSNLPEEAKIVPIKGRLMVRDYNEEAERIKAFARAFGAGLKQTDAFAKSEMARHKARGGE